MSPSPREGRAGGGSGRGGSETHLSMQPPLPVPLPLRGGEGEENSATLNTYRPQCADSGICFHLRLENSTNPSVRSRFLRCFQHGPSAIAISQSMAAE